jgi:hypothetical protein
VLNLLPRLLLVCRRCPLFRLWQALLLPAALLLRLELLLLSGLLLPPPWLLLGVIPLQQRLTP